MEEMKMRNQERIRTLKFLVILREPLLGKQGIESFVHFASVFYLFTALHERRIMASNLFLLHTLRDFFS